MRLSSFPRRHIKGGTTGLTSITIAGKIHFTNGGEACVAVPGQIVPPGGVQQFACAAVSRGAKVSVAENKGNSPAKGLIRADNLA